MNDRNLIRFDWAIKRLLRNKADYSIWEGFLSELLNDDISIQNILQSESNQRMDTDKFNRVDILVKNSNDELVIVEIQNQNEYDYFHRMAYGTSKAITDYISVGEPYKNIKKVFSINIVYSDLGQGEDYVYHGKTDFIGIHRSDKLMLSERQTDVIDKAEPFQVFPEYYVIKVNRFNDIAMDSLDQWIYYLKNNEIKEEFTARGIDKAKELWRVDNLSKEEQKNYYKYIGSLRDGASMAWTMKVEVEDKIREEERMREKKQIARELKKNNIPTELIVKSTGLAIEEIERLNTSVATDEAELPSHPPVLQQLLLGHIL